MQAKRSLNLFSDKLFPVPSDELHLNNPIISSLVERAREELKAQAGDACSLLSPQAQEQLPSALSGLLARLLLLGSDSEYLEKAVRFWVEAQCEMLLRLQLDRTEIEEIFYNGDHCGQVKEFILDLSDRHDRGRSVAALTFESGLKLVYKPRDIGIEAWYFHTLQWLNQIGAPLPFQILRVLSRPGYGWVQFISHRRCCCDDELVQYYRNAGALLCLLHVLRAQDCHFQNLVACGKYPVLVDAETLFQPQFTDSEIASVERTGMIPHWRFGPQGQAYDVSALGCVVPRLTHFWIPRWRDTGVQFEFGVLTPQENVPFSVDDPITPQSYVEDMVEGFAETYLFLVDHRSPLLAKIKTAAGLQVRYLVRETVEYYEALNDGLGSTTISGVTLRTLTKSRAVFDPLLPDEVNALKQLDIPRFTLPTTSCDLCEVENSFRACGLEMAIDHIERLGARDLEQQVTKLRLSWSLFRLASSLS